jgi:hypothetical protein
LAVKRSSESHGTTRATRTSAATEGAGSLDVSRCRDAGSVLPAHARRRGDWRAVGGVRQRVVAMGCGAARRDDEGDDCEPGYGDQNDEHVMASATTSSYMGQSRSTGAIGRYGRPLEWPTCRYDVCLPAGTPLLSRHARPGDRGGAAAQVVLELRHGCFSASQAKPTTNRIAHRIQPSAVVPTPTYFRPDAVTTNVIMGLM